MSMRAARAKSETTNSFKDLGDLVRTMSAALQPPERLLPSEAAEKYRFLQIPGAYHGPYLNETTPYMTEPLNVLADREKRGCIFVGPAQSGKTDSLVLNAILYKIICDPIDTIVYQTSQTVAADFSRTRVDRMHRHSPETGKRLLPASSADTVHAKYYDSGIVLNLSWPTINEMSGRPRGLVILTDYDRMPQDVDGEGSPFDLGMKRTTTYRSAGKTICESSPGFEVTAGSTWIPRSKHEAPPCDGIMALYNRGDRRRWYWKCPECGEWFEPAFDLLKYPTDCSASVSGTKAWMACPHNACVIEASKKFDLNKGGRWLRDGQRLTSSDVLEGEGVVSSIASFWMMGVAAAFAPWASLVEKYLQAEQEYERTGSQEALKATVNTDQGVPYRRRGQNTERRPEELKNRASQWPRGTAPAETRFLVATVDIQGRKWVCQVHGVTPGRPYELVLVDRFDITKSERRDADGERCPVEPASYAEDWELLKPNLLEREYAIAGTDKMMAIKHVFCDSGGKAGVTARAYAFWQSLRQEGDGLQRRFQLVKGDPLPGAPRAKVNYMDAAVKGSSASVRGEVPVLMLNSNILKDQLDGMLNAPDQIRWAEWLPDEFFSELCVEFRELNGWKNPKRHRNEAWDLLYYCVGGCVWLGVENINWEAPPSWALPATEGNTLCRTKEEEPKFKPKSKGFTDMAAFGNMLA